MIDISISNEPIEAGLVKCQNSSIRIGTLDGSINVNLLQLESKNILSAKDFIAGHKMFNDIRLPS